MFRFSRLSILALAAFLVMTISLLNFLLLPPNESKHNGGLTGFRALNDTRNQSGEIIKLQAKVDKLQKELSDLQRKYVKSMERDVGQKQTEYVDVKGDSSFYSSFFKKKIAESEVKEGKPFHNEYEVIPFVRFTIDRIYVIDPGMGKRVVEKPIGHKKKDLHEAILAGVQKLNENHKTNKYKISHFVEGIYRTEPSIGTHYDLLFMNAMDHSNMHERVVLSRPFGPIHYIGSEMKILKSELINIILPLSGRIDKLKSFMNNFRDVCINGDKNVFLTVVYFGLEGLGEVKSVLNKVIENDNFNNIKLVTLDGKFSRGRGLQVGAQSWSLGKNVLLFFCDVDVVFHQTFLDRCRLNAEPGIKVYYPMVFSLYNPSVVYAIHDLKVPPLNDQLVINKEAGFWRDFGFGMTCQYMSDFLAVKGFDEDIQGWGKEDVFLYKKHVSSNIMVVRASDPSIFHIWHEKDCEKLNTLDQYRSCIRTKALNEASHAQLGMLAFKDDIKHFTKKNSEQRDG